MRLTKNITNKFKKVRKALIILEQTGFKRLSYIIYISLILPVIMDWLLIYSNFYRIIKKICEYLKANKDIRHYKSKKEELLRFGETGYRQKIEDFGLNPENLELLKEKLQQQHEVVIADIDQDGFLLTHFGPIKDAQTISKKEFLSRKRFNLKIISINGLVAIKKHYKGNKLSFITELKALHNLRLAGCNVPAIMDIDFDNLALTFSYILGFELQMELSKRGAELLDHNLDNNPHYKSLSKNKLRLKYFQEGKRVLYNVINKEYINRIFIELKIIHKAGFIWKDIKYGNILIEKKSWEPYLVDFDTTYDYSKVNKNLFRILCDRNIEDFNLCFDTDKLTYIRIRNKIKNKKALSMNNLSRSLYSPVYFGYGLLIGSLFKNYVGYGRWHFILEKYLPPLLGKRILDLGANNAFHSIQMLRNGAREVIGIELNSEPVALGKFIKEVFEWADDKTYNFKYIQSDMSKVNTMNLGNFDFVTALCSIYYLDDKSISDLINYTSKITNIFILQCNIETDIGRDDPYSYTKASVEYAVNALKNNGFPFIQIIAPQKYSRPLVIGRK